MTLKFLIKDALEDMPPEIKEVKAGQMISTEWFIKKLLTGTPSEVILKFLS